MNEKLVINTDLLRKEAYFRTRSCVVEKAIAVPHTKFIDLKENTLTDLCCKAAEVICRNG